MGRLVTFFVHDKSNINYKPSFARIRAFGTRKTFDLSHLDPLQEIKNKETINKRHYR